MAAPSPTGRLQQMLQSAVQAVRWTYSLFWQFDPHQGLLVWSEGYYNGAIKTRKTVEPVEVSSEEASLQRSQQLRELYDSLSAKETKPSAKRPCAALSPEDLTETEWFYLMCVSFSFPPAVGLPGKAYVKRQHVWLTGAHEADSKVFSRAILAKSARIQSIVCIPLMDGVVELGSTERVHEDPSLVEHVKTFFVGHRLPPPKPALSEHSTSNPAASSPNLPAHFHSPPMPATSSYVATDPIGASNLNQPINRGVGNEEDDENVANESDTEAETARNSRPTLAAGRPRGHSMSNSAGVRTTAAEPSEVMQLDMSEDIRLGSPDDASINLDSTAGAGGRAALTTGGINTPVNPMVDKQRRADSFSGAQSSRRWRVMQRYPLLQPPHTSATGASLMEDLSPEDTHYSQTVTAILQHQATRCPSEPVANGPSVFIKWPARSDHHLHLPSDRTPQRLLKYILLTVPFLHSKRNDGESPKTHEVGPEPTTRFRNKGAAQDELSANHVLAERRRREKLNERFIILRSLVPFVTKMDKASILGDTIEYLKQLRRKLQELETSTRQMETERSARVVDQQQRGVTVAERARTVPGLDADKKKIRAVEGSGGAKAKTVVAPPLGDMVQVSIIESDALIELQCPYKEGLLLDLMLTLREMRVEVTAVQSSVNNGFFAVELRAKVKEGANGKKPSIVEVKRAIYHHIVPHTDES